jgi:hypothetical protein
MAAQERGLKPKDSFKECADCPEMVVVPAGSFTMGSPGIEKDRDKDEGPQHVVTISRPFAVGRLDVTVNQFRVFATETQYSAHSGCDWRNPRFKQDSSHPVVCISWDDASAYTNWLAQKTGRPYRLLSEAEWEYAARAETSTPFWWGSSITPAQANYDGNYVYAGGGSKGEYRKVRCQPAVSKPIRGVFTTFTAMRGNGRRIAIMTATPGRLTTVQRGQQEVVMAALSAVVPGTTLRGSSAPPGASSTPACSTISVSAWPGRLHLNPLLVCPEGADHQ